MEDRTTLATPLVESAGTSCKANPQNDCDGKRDSTLSFSSQVVEVCMLAWVASIWTLAPPLFLSWLVVLDLHICTVIVSRNTELQSLLMFN